jgi:putative selenium metabolism hydrolase
LNLSIGQRGRAEIEVITKGETSHASMPELGKNAVYSMATIINEIEKLNETLPTDSRLGKGSITIINISSSPEQGNIVPDKCRIVVDRRTITGETEEVVLNELNEILNSLMKKIPDLDADLKIVDEKIDCYTGKSLFNHKYFPAWNIDPSTPIIQKAKNSLESALEREVAITTWRFSTDGVYTAGVANIPTIGFGPGDENQAHSPNEHLEIDQLIQSAKGNATLALRLLSD